LGPALEIGEVKVTSVKRDDGVKDGGAEEAEHGVAEAEGCPGSGEEEAE
jgi:lipoate synthase